MLDRIIKATSAIGLLLLGIAALLWSQNDRYRFISDGAMLFDSRTGDVFIPVDRPDVPNSKHAVQMNLKTGVVREVSTRYDPTLIAEFHTQMMNDCRSYMKDRMSVQPALRAISVTPYLATSKHCPMIRARIQPA